MSIKHYTAVVASGCYACDSEEGPLAMAANTMPLCSSIIDLAERHKLETVWIMPDCPLSHADPVMFCNLDQTTWNVRYYKTEASTNRLPRMKKVVAWRHHGDFEAKRDIHIYWPEQTVWNWESLNVLELLDMLLRLRADLDVPIDDHPGSVGRSLMDKLVSREHKQVPHINLYSIEGVKCARDFAWKGAITKGQFLHAYDKNSMYLSAASNAALGVGDPTWYLGPSITQFKLNRAGIWKIAATPPMIPNLDSPLGKFADRLPFPLAPGQEWATTPVIKCLLEMGYFVELLEGYQWENSKRVLGDWATFVWDRRQQYKAEDDPTSRLAYASMKRIATASIGLLGHRSDNIYQPEWARPDWWSTIIETAKARMLYNMDKNAKEYGIFPVLVFVDCLYYVSDSSSPDCRLLGKAEDLGGYKHKGTWPITPQVVDWFNSDMAPAAINRALTDLEVDHAG